MAPSEETSDRRGGGGKFRREPNRSTPYERPPLDSGRIRKNVIDPALRITKTASHKLFSLLFPNNLPRISSNSEVNCELRDAFPAVPSNASGAQEQVTIENGSLNNNSHSSAINDFEQMITQKTFTRNEVEHLIELLQSKTSDVPAVDEHRRIERSTSELVEAPSGKGKFSSKDNEIKSQTVHVIGSAHLSSSSILESDVASPAELAKAYMGRSSSKLTPLPINLHTHTFREDSSWKTNLPFTPKSNSMLLGPGTGVPYGSVARRSENGYATPVSRGRSDTYSVACTPYSRAHHTSMLKAVDPMTNGRAGFSTLSQRSWVSGGKQTSKRRSSVLDCDIGSIGAIRRTRRKTNMMFPTGNTGLLISKSPLPIPLTPIGSDAVKGDCRPISSHQKKLLLDETKHSTSVGCHIENGENRIAGKRSVGVPTQSVETAQKIFRELEKCFSSPKGKSPELMTTTVIEGSPPKLTPGDSFVTGDWDLISQKQAVVDVGGPSKIFISEELGSQSHGVVTDLSAKDTISPTKAINVIQEKPVFGGTEKWGAVALGSNSIRSRDKSSTLDTVRRKDDTSVVESKGIADGGESMVPPFNVNTTASFLLGKSSGSGALDEKDIRFAGPVTSVTGVFTKEDASTSLSSSPSSLSRPSTYGEPTGVQCSLAMKSVDEATLFTFSSASVGNQSSDLDGAQSEGKLDTVSRCCSTGTPTSKESRRSSSSDNVDNGDLFRQVKHTIPSSAPSSSTPEFSYRTMNVPTTSSVVVPDPFPERSRSNTMFPDPSSSTTSALTVTKVDSSIFSGSLHQSGLCTAISAAPMNSASVKPKSTNSESKTKSTSSFSTLESPFGIKTLPFTGSSSSSGSSVFGASATSSAALPAVDNKLQIFNTSGADSGSLPGTVSSAFTQSLQKQLDTSASSQVFGLSRPFSASSGGVLSVSLPPSAKLSEIDSTSPLGSATPFASPPALFSSSPQPSTSSIFGTSFSSTGFDFGSSSAATASLSSSLMASGSSLSTSSGSIFTFMSAANVNSGPLSSSFLVSTGANPFSSFSSVSPDNDQMNIEDCTAKPTVPASNPMIPDFGQPSSSSQSNFVFSASSSSGGAPIFPFSSQQNPGSFEMSGGGLFSVGTGGGVEKSNRRYIKAKRDKLRKR